MTETVMLAPIGTYHSTALHPYDVGRQPRPDDTRPGEIRLFEGHNFEQALIGLEGFDRIWIVFLFDRNAHWKPMVQPPRGSDGKQGVFATRAPYRPNPVGLSCVKLKSVDGRTLLVEGADLLDGSPILDLKPYVPESDAFPESRVGWLERAREERYRIEWSPGAAEQRDMLEREGVVNLTDFAVQQLEYSPFDRTRKRVERLGSGEGSLAYRTWRLVFAEGSDRSIEILRIHSGYDDSDLASEADKWGDKDLHRRFRARFPLR